MSQSLILSLPLAGSDLAPYVALNSAARAALPAEYDGWRSDDPPPGGGWPSFDLYFYGADAAEMWARLRPVLAGSPLLPGGLATLHFGTGAAGGGSSEAEDFLMGEGPSAGESPPASGDSSASEGRA